MSIGTFVVEVCVGWFCARAGEDSYSISVLLCRNTAEEEHASITTSSVSRPMKVIAHTSRGRPFAIMAVYGLIKIVSLMTLYNGVCKITNLRLLSRIHSVDANLCREVGFKLYAFAFKLNSDDFCQEACAPKFRVLESIIKPSFGRYYQRPMTGLPTRFDWLGPCMFNGRICVQHKSAEFVTGAILANPFCNFQYSELCASTLRTAVQSCLCQRNLKLYRVYRVPIQQKGTDLNFDCDPDQICQRLQERLKLSWACHGSVVIRQAIICKDRRDTKWCWCNKHLRLDKAVECEEVLLPFTLVSATLTISLTLSPAAAEETPIAAMSDDLISSSLLLQRAEYAAELGLWLAGEDMLDSLESNPNHVKTASN